MSALVYQQFLASVEDSMQSLSENAYQGAIRRSWFPLVGKHRETMSRRTYVNWLLTTAQLHRGRSGGSADFVSMAFALTVLEVEASQTGLRLQRSEFEDSMQGEPSGEGINIALAWAEQMGAAIAHEPQKLAAEILRRGHLAGSAGGFDAYDGKPFFSMEHDVNPYEPKAGTYSNLLTGSADGAYPGACPIDDTVTLDVALENYASVLGHIGAIKMPHGEGLRCLRPRALLVPPRMAPRALRVAGLTAVPPIGPDATLLDVAEVANAAGIVLPVHVPELSGFEDETSYFVACEQVASSELGAVICMEREPHAIRYHGPNSDVLLSRTDTIEWHVKGRNKIAPGHPFLLFKVKAS